MDAPSDPREPVLPSAHRPTATPAVGDDSGADGLPDFGDAPDSAASRRLAADVLRRRCRGEFVPDSAVLAAADNRIRPYLERDLSALEQVQRAMLGARRAGRLDRLIRPLDDRALEADGPDGWPAAQDDGSVDGTRSSANGALTEPDVDAVRVRIEGYAVLDEVSSGGQGVVYKALHQATGRCVAVKVMYGLNSRARARADREAAFLATVDHPNVVKIFDRGRTADGAFYLAMDFVDGYALDEYLGPACPHGPGDLATLLALFARLCGAVGAAHAAGVVHRDLKPSNVRVDRHGEPRVLDFGLARPSPLARDAWPAQVTVTDDGQVVGSLPWASPEQARGAGDECGPAGDVYALGVMLYGALTGGFPYPVQGPIAEVIAHIERTVPPPPSARALPRWGPIPQAVDAVVMRCLEKDAGRRFVDAAALSAALGRVTVLGSAATPEDLLALAPDRSPSTAVTAELPPRPWWRRRAVAAAGIAVAACAAWALLPPDAPQDPRGAGPNASALALAGPTSQPHSPPHLGPQPPDPFRHASGMTFVHIPRGRFVMGSPQLEFSRQLDEREHGVVISRAFYLSAHEVTQAQFRQVMGRIPEQSWWGEDLPAHNVQWDHAVAFCAALSKQDGRRYRLPTEAEWEYAARAGSNTPYAGGARLTDVGWFAENSGGALQPVGRKRPNAWGLYDVHGNAREWCSDAWGEHYEFDPWQDSVDPSGPPKGEIKISRGGNAESLADECRAAHRGRLYWNDNRSRTKGFRVVLELP